MTVPVPAAHYCAEQFTNDVALPNVILKALKRMMAAEYSRELSEKVFSALRRVATQAAETKLALIQ